MKKNLPIAFAFIATFILLSPFLIFKVIVQIEKNEKEDRLKASNISNTPEAQRIFERYFDKTTMIPKEVFGYVESLGNGESLTYLRVNDSDWIKRIQGIIEKSPKDRYWFSIDTPQWFLSENAMKTTDSFRHSYDGTNVVYIWVSPEGHSLYLLRIVT